MAGRSSGAASGGRPSFLQRHPRIFWYIPNLIGYARIVLTLGALSSALAHPGASVCAYFLAFVCDELDGRAARAFSQTSTLGAVLDMVTDRVATTGLLALLGAVYPAWLPLFVALVALDVFSHWFQMYSALLAGAATHKDVRSRSRLVRLYYTHRIFMGFCCVCCEVCYLALFLASRPGWASWGMVPLPPLPAAAVRALAPAAGAAASAVAAAGAGRGAGAVAAALAAAGRAGGAAGGGASAAAAAAVGEQLLRAAWPAALPAVWLVVLAALPGVAVKQACNWVQLRTAMEALVEWDVKRMA